MANLVKVKLQLDSQKFKSEGVDVEKVAISGGAAFDSFKAKVTAFSFAYNQVGEVVQKVANVIAQPIQKFSELEDSIANVHSLGVPNINEIRSGIIEMSEDVSVPLSDLSSGMYEVVSAGVDTANQINVLELSAKAAKAGVADTTSAIQLSSAVIKGYGEDWSFTRDVLDDAFQTVKLGQTNFVELSSNTGKIIPLFSALKISSDELFGSLATLTGVTGNTAEVSTQLSAIGQELAAPTKELSLLIKEQTGLTVEQAVAQGGLEGILKIVGEETKGSAAAMRELFSSSESLKAMLALTTSQYDTFIEKTDAMRNSSGAMNNAFEIQNDTISSQIQILENRWDNAMIRAAEMVVPFTNNIIDLALGITNSGNEIDSLVKSFDDYQSQISDLDSIDSLIGRYEDLLERTSLNDDEHRQLSEIIATLSTQYPGAITEVDQYGKAIGVSAESVKLLVQQQRELLKAQNADIISKSLDSVSQDTDVILDRNNALAELQNKLTSIQRQQQSLPGATGGILKNLADEYEDKKTKINNDITELQENVSQANDDLGKSVLLLSNFYNFDTETSVLTKTMNQSVETVQLLKQKYQELTEVKEVAEDSENNLKLTVKPVFTEEPVFDIPEEEVFVPDAFNIESELDNAMLQVETWYAEASINDQQYHDFKRNLLEAELAHFIDAEGAKSDAAFQSRIRISEFDKRQAEKKKELEKKSTIHSVGQLGILMQQSQGINAELFAVGKVSAIAQATMDTYAGANKAIANLPPPLSFAVAALTIATGLANVAKISSTNFEKKRDGGIIASEFRTVARGDFGEGENRLIIANAGEFIVNREATGANRALLEAINSGQSVTPNSSSGSSLQRVETLSHEGLVSEFVAFREDVVEAIGNINVVFESVLDGQKFLRLNFQEFERKENARRF